MRWGKIDKGRINKAILIQQEVSMLIIVVF